MRSSVVCLQQQSTFKVRDPESKCVVRHYALQVSSGEIFNISWMMNGRVGVSVYKDTVHSKEKVLRSLFAVHGVNQNTLYMRNKQNDLFKATIRENKEIICDKFKMCPAFPTDAPPSKTFPSVFHIESGPYRAFREGNRLRIMRLELNPATAKADQILELENFPVALDPHAAVRSVVHRGMLIMFFESDTPSCRRIGEKVINVYSPLFYNLPIKTPFSPLIYAQDHSDIVYMIEAMSEILLIVDPGKLRMSESRLALLMNLVGVFDGSLSIGVPELINTTKTKFNGSRIINSYTIWTGKLPVVFNWTYDSSHLSHFSPWNVNVPEFVPNKNADNVIILTSDDFPPLNAVKVKASSIASELSSTDTSSMHDSEAVSQTEDVELESLRQENGLHVHKTNEEENSNDEALANETKKNAEKSQQISNEIAKEQEHIRKLEMKKMLETMKRYSRLHKNVAMRKFVNNVMQGEDL